MDCVSTVTTEIMRDLGDGEPTPTLAIDIKGAFNTVFPGVLIQNLKEFGVAATLINFIWFLTTQKRLCFSERGARQECGVGVTQGGTSPPILFNLVLRKLD